MTSIAAHRIEHAFLASPEELIDEARNGRMMILVDDENRENEGDLVIPAQMATPEAINFMARFGRGLICLALTEERVAKLGLPPMSQSNGTLHQTAFTVSIEAREGVSTGISAADRARTISVAINSTNGPSDIVSPGHVFPLTARRGGVLVRAGHTEAAIDVARLAGLNPSGVICEIMNDDGTMARLDDLIAFAQQHRLKIGTIRDLIAYRRRHDHDVVKVAETNFTSRFGGEWRAITYRNKAVHGETVVLVKGKIDDGEPVLVRMHRAHLLADLLGETGRRAGLLENAMRAIENEGRGVVVLLLDSSIDSPSALMMRRSSGAPVQAEEAFRDYGLGAQILAELGVHEMIVLTNSHHTPVALAGYGLRIVGERALPFAE